MTTLEFWTQTPLAKALGWALLHSLWEGAAIAVLLAAGLCAVRSPRARYGAACLALLSVFAAFLITLGNLWPATGGPGARHVFDLSRLPAIDLTAPDTAAPQAFRAADLLPWLAPFWMLGVLVFHLRALAGWIAARRLRGSGVCCAATQWSERLERLAARVRVSRPVILFESSLADAPLVIGYLRPVILMPVGLLAGLPVAHVEAILAHELAHIRRQDYLVNLLQTFVEGLLFYHPAVWWISHSIRVERENCCDDLAVAISGDAREYAAALAALEQNRWTARELALAATGGNLVKRIRRLLVKPERTRVGLAPLASAIALLIATAAGLAAWQTTPAAVPQRSATSAASLPATPVVAAVDAQAPVNDVPARPVRKPARAIETARVSEPMEQTQDPAQSQIQTQYNEALRKLAALANKQQTRETKQAFEASPYGKWLTQDVPYIITDQERAAYKALATDAERDSFIEQFWQRRDPTPGTAENEFKEEHYRRIAYANEHFATTNVPSLAGWKTDRGRIYITFGPPDEIEDHSSGGFYKRPAEEGGGETTTVPFQQWRYRYIESVGNNIVIEFVDPTYTHEFRMTKDPAEKDALRFVVPVPGGLSFISVGGDPQVTVEVGVGGWVMVRVAANGIAGKWDYTLAVTSDSKSVANARDAVKLGASSAGERFESDHGFKLSAGSYTVSVSVKDPTGATQVKSVNFYVN
jgi:GWxTD domain-containing protein